MKSYNATYKPFKKPVFTVLFVIFANFIFAQNASHLPYSRYGIGEIQATQSPRSVALGGLSVGLVSRNDVSSQNPASYLNLDSLAVHFEVSFQLSPSKLREKQANSEMLSANTNSASLGQFSLAFPITSWLKSSFGIMPNSNMSYRVQREVSGGPHIGQYLLKHEGDGGVNQVFLGIAAGTKRISVGANVNYHFGTFDRQAEIEFTDTILPLPSMPRLNKVMEVRGVSFDFGLQYRQPLSDQYQLGIGLTYNPTRNLKAIRSIQGTSVIGNESLIDTIVSTDNETGTLKLPDGYAVGLSLEKSDRWVWGVEYAATHFKNYREFGESDPNMANAYTFRTGLELKGQRTNPNFLGRITYRLGYHYGTHQIIFENSQIKQYGVSLGIGIPIRRTLSRLDLSVEFGRKGNANIGQIQENYGRIVVGIAAFERWFMREKFE